MRLLLREVFLDEGFEVEVASDGVEALRKFSGRRPALILLDLRMPGMSGLDFLRQVQEMIGNGGG